MLKHIKSFEDYNDNSVNEALFGLIKSLGDYAEKIGQITKQTSDEEITKLFTDLFQKQGTKTTLATPPWLRIKKYLNSGKISTQTMVQLLNEAKLDYDENNDMGYLMETKGQLVYKKSVIKGDTSAWTGTGNG